MNSFDNSILRISGPDNRIVGTGFLVASDLAVTCAHVVIAAEAIAGDTILVQFTNQKKQIPALVEPLLWLDENKGDIALLRLTEVPDGIYPLRLAPAADCRPGSAFRSHGYTTAADVQGIIVEGTIKGYLTEHQLLQLKSAEADEGVSGAPVLDKRGVVLGMITKGHKELGRNEHTTFATPSETIWQVCPQLKPPSPALPRRNPIVEGINLLPYDYDVRIQNFLTEYLGTDSHPAPFGGRDDALKILYTWLAQTTPYLLLAAPAGLGKSALLVRWLDSLKDNHELSLVFMPVSIRFGTNMERVFYAALAARLAYLHGDDIPASPETSTAVYRGLVADYLSRPLANGRTLLVVLDGLDEAADWQAGADFMPGELPAGMRVVVSARFLAGDADSTPWLRRLNWERTGMASAPSLTPLDQAGVQDVLFKMGCPLDELSRKVNIIEKLHYLSTGDPLLVGLYVGDLWAKGEEVTRLTPEDLANIQPGYKGYFDRWWEDQKKLWGKEKPWLKEHVRVVRNLLAGAIGPLKKRDFQTLSPDLKSDYLVDALEILGRFISGDDKIQGYTFNHPKLREYFWEALSPKEQVHTEKCFISWGKNTVQSLVDEELQPADVPHYLLLNYSVHLGHIQTEIDNYLPIVDYPYWHEAWLAYEGAYGGYLRDVLSTWKKCQEPHQREHKVSKSELIGKQIRCSLIKASLHSLAGQIDPKILYLMNKHRLWTLNQSLAYIQQMKIPHKQAESLILIIPLIQETYLFDSILSISEKINDERAKAKILSALAIQAPISYGNKIFEASYTISNAREQFRVLISLAETNPEIVNTAINCANNIVHEQEKLQAFCELSKYSVQAFQNTLKSIQNIRDLKKKVDIYCELSFLIPIQQIENLLTATQEINSATSRAYVLSVISNRIPSLAPRVLESIEKISDESEREKVLSSLAKSTSCEYVPSILVAADNLKDRWKRFQVLINLVEKFREIPKVIEHIHICIDGIDDDWKKIQAYCSLAQLSVKGAFQTTLELLQIIKEDAKKTIILQRLINIAPSEHLADLCQIAREIPDIKSRAYSLSNLAKIFPELSDEVLDLAKKVPSDAQRANILSALARNAPQHYLSKILIEANHINQDWERGWVLNALAERLPEAAQAAVLLKTNKIGDNIKGLRILCLLVKHIPQESEYLLNISSELKNDRDIESIINILSNELDPKYLKKLGIIATRINNPIIRSRILISMVCKDSNLAIEAFESIKNIKGDNEIGRRYSYLLNLLFEIVRSKKNITTIGAEICRHLATEYWPSMIRSTLNILFKFIFGLLLLLALIAFAPLIILLIPVLVFNVLAQKKKSTWPSVSFLKRVSVNNEVLLQNWYTQNFRIQASELRMDIFERIYIYLPILKSINNNGVIKEIFYSVRDVTTWWP